MIARVVAALVAVGMGVVTAVTHRPLSGWTLLACVLIVAGFALLVELTHPLVDDASEGDL